MKLFPCLLIVLLAGAASAVDLLEPATIITSTGSEIAGNVVIETLDGVEYRIGTGDSEASTSLARPKIRAVVYQNEINDTDYSKGQGSLARKEFDKAATSFLVAASSGASGRSTLASSAVMIGTSAASRATGGSRSAAHSR